MGPKVVYLASVIVFAVRVPVKRECENGIAGSEVIALHWTVVQSVNCPLSVTSHCWPTRTLYITVFSQKLCVKIFEDLTCSITTSENSTCLLFEVFGHCMQRRFHIDIDLLQIPSHFSNGSFHTSECVTVATQLKPVLAPLAFCSSSK